MKNSIQQAFHLELIKIPTQVKEMPLSRFREEFGESLEAVTRGAIGGTNSNPRGNIKLTKVPSGKVIQTPLHNRQGILSDTAMRNPREGETILSQNGSPLGVFNTVIKPAKSGPGLIPATPGVFVPLESGEIVELDKVESLPDNLKQDAVQKMQIMMNNMQQMMSKLVPDKKK